MTKNKATLDGQEEIRQSGLTVNPQSVKDIAKEYMSSALEQVVRDLKKDFITIFGLFAALIAFLVVEVQIFSNTSRFSLVVGISAFLLAALLAFTLSLRSIFTDTLKEGWKVYLHPLVVLIGVFLAISGLSFWWYVSHPSPKPANHPIQQMK